MSEAREFDFEMVSPECKLISEPLYRVEIPGDEGVFGVMSGHCSLVSSLSPGVVTLHKTQDGDIRRIFIAGGFADVTPNGCTILAEDAINVQDLDKDSLEQHLRDLSEDLEMAQEEADKVRVQAKIHLTQAKLAAVRDIA